jgi:hypothetical protein
LETWSLSIILTEGVHVLHGRVTDVAGLQTTIDIDNVTIDLTPPSLILVNPSDSLITNASSVTCSGTVEVGARVFINGLEVEVHGTAYSAEINLPVDGRHDIYVTAQDVAGNTFDLDVFILRDTTPPHLLIVQPSPGYLIKETSVSISGLTEDGADLTISGVPRPVWNGTFEITFDLEEGVNEIIIEVRDEVWNKQNLTLYVTRDTEPPDLVITRPTDDQFINTHLVVIAGTVSSDAALLTCSEIEIGFSDGLFDIELVLAEGPNTIVVEARDLLGNIMSKTVRVTVDSIPPTLTVDAPLTGSITREAGISVRGSMLGGAILLVDGEEIEMVDGSFNVSVDLSETGSEGPPNVILIKALDKAGNEVVVEVEVFRDSTGPGLVMIAPPNSTRDLWVWLNGSVAHVSDLSYVEVHGVTVPVTDEGEFSVVLPLEVGSNTFIVFAVDTSGNEEIERISIDRKRPERSEDGPTLNTSTSLLAVALFIVGMVISYLVVGLRKGPADEPTAEEPSDDETTNEVQQNTEMEESPTDDDQVFRT